MKSKGVYALFALQLFLVFWFWLLITGYWGYVVTVIKEILLR